MILRTAVYFGLAYEPILPAREEASLTYLIYPKFVLWNPHNVPIASARYVVQVRAMTSLNANIKIAGTSITHGARNLTQGINYRGQFQAGSRFYTRINFFNGGEAAGRDPDDGYSYFTFVIDSVGFAPGETLLFTAEDRQPKTDSEYSNAHVQEIAADFSQHNLLVNEDQGPFGFFYIRSSGASLTPDPPTAAVPISDTDVFQTALFFQNIPRFGTGDPDRDRSLTTKLYRYNAPGDVELLEFIDLMQDSGTVESNWDWESIKEDGFSQTSDFDAFAQTLDFRSFSSILANPGTATFERGHGYYLSPMDPASSKNQFRSFGRYNVVVSEKGVDEPFLEPSTSGGTNGPETIEYLRSGGMYVDAAPAKEWFDVEFQAEIPISDNSSYQNLSIDGYDSPGGFGLYQANNGGIEPEQGTIYPIYDRVRAETGLLSLGFLKNVNFAQHYWQPTFPFGNSEAHAHVDRELVQQSHAGTNYYDLSYLLNESLWDRFFVSTIPQTGALTPGQDFILPNSSHRFNPRRDGSFPSAAELRNSQTGFETAAASLAVEGAFNVNSTSLDAWRMFLASHLGESVETADNEQSNASDRAPFGGKAFPLTGEAPRDSQDAVGVSSPKVWSGLRALSAAEIDALAEAMVEEVKRRGPFLSLADFVNRRLIPDGDSIEEDYLGLKGALQAAIDKVSVAGISAAPLNAPFHADDLALTTDEVSSIALDPEHETGSPSGVAGSRMYGAPGYLTQADVLASLGSALTVRGDTFTIRTYGESITGPSGEIGGRAWCEVVVQRIADPVDPNDSIVQPTGPFGRSFKILSQRWLTEDDII